MSFRFDDIPGFIVMPNLVAKFRELEFEFTKVYERIEITDKEHGIFAEIDAFLENGDKVMVVEAKTNDTFNITVPKGKYHPHEW